MHISTARRHIPRSEHQPVGLLINAKTNGISVAPFRARLIVAVRVGGARRSAGCHVCARDNELDTSVSVQRARGNCKRTGTTTTTDLQAATTSICIASIYALQCWRGLYSKYA